MGSSLPIVNNNPPGESCGAGVSINVRDAQYSVSPSKFMGRAAVVTLGCAKNQVDSEVMLGVLKNSGYEIVTDIKRADVVIVNTCSFLESAVKESVDAILEVSEQKKNGQLRKLIVAGCLVERYRDELTKTLPEVDSFISNDDITKVGEAANAGLTSILADGARPYFLYDDTVPRALATPRHTAYVKIAEGCNRPCTFCIIPKIRGAMRSREIGSVVKEVAALGAQGVKEINLIAQDLTSFGTDRKEGNLAKLLRDLDAAGSVDWIRLLYAYPIGVDAELLSAITQSERVCKYLDIPLQHASESVLKEMKRPLGRFSPRNIVEFIRGSAPEIHIRTTFIVGFPGETEKDVDALETFISEGHFTNVGIFTYSLESGTPAFDMPGQVPEKVKKSRRDRLMRAQKKVNDARLKAMIGTTVPVLIEGFHEDTDLLFKGRTAFQAPEVDGVVLINDVADGLPALAPGAMGTLLITETAGYDLVGQVVGLGAAQSLASTTQASVL